MIAAWMVRIALATALIALAAYAAEGAARAVGRPRRWVWASALAAAVALPALARLAPGAFPGLDPFAWILPDDAGPEWTWLAALAALAADPTGADGAVADAVGPGNGLLDRMALGLWLLGSVAVAGLFLQVHARLVRRRSRWPAREFEGGPALVSEAFGPATVGLFRPAVVLPRWAERLPAEERALVIRHEREHLRAGDSRLLAAATLPLALLPWCPPLWWMHRRLRDAVEADCDARVLARGADLRTYGRVLLRTAGRRSRVPFQVPALCRTSSPLERRILAMTSKQPKHPFLAAAVLTVAAAAAALAACGTLDSEPTAPVVVEAEDEAIQHALTPAARRQAVAAFTEAARRFRRVDEHIDFRRVEELLVQAEQMRKMSETKQPLKETRDDAGHVDASKAATPTHRGVQPDGASSGEPDADARLRAQRERRLVIERLNAVLEQERRLSAGGGQGR